MLTALGRFGVLLSVVVSATLVEHNEFGYLVNGGRGRSLERSLPSTDVRKRSVSLGGSNSPLAGACKNVTLVQVKNLSCQRRNGTKLELECKYHYGYRLMLTKQHIQLMVDQSPGANVYNWTNVMELGGNWTDNFKESTKIYTLPALGYKIRLTQPVIQCDNIELYSDDLVVNFEEGCKVKMEYILEKVYPKGNADTSHIYNVAGVGVQVCGYTDEELMNGVNGTDISALTEELDDKFKKLNQTVNQTDLVWKSEFFNMYNMNSGIQLMVNVPAGKYGRLYRAVGKCGMSTVFTDSYFIKISEEELVGPANINLFQKVERYITPTKDAPVESRKRYRGSVH